MKNFLFLILWNTACTGLAMAQPAIQWEKCLGGTAGEWAQSIRQTVDSGFVVAGYTNSNDSDVSGQHGNDDLWIVKLSSSGSMLWQKCFGGTGYDEGYSIHQTSDGGFICAGFSNSNDGDVSGNHGSDDFWIVKLSSTGAIQWQKCLGGTALDDAFFIQPTADGGYIVSGDTESNDGDVSGNHGGYDSWVVKLDSAGAIQWQKCLGGTGDDSALGIQQTTDGGYIVGGSTTSNDGDVSGNHGNWDYWIVRLDSAGNILWQKCLGGTNQDIGYSILQSADNGYIVAGFTRSNNGDVSGLHGSGSQPDQWVVKMDSAGNILWQKCLGGNGDDKAYSIQQTDHGSFIVAGYTKSNDGDVSGSHGTANHDYWIVMLDTAGNIQWQKCLGGVNSDWARDVAQAGDSSYVIAGFSYSTDGDVTGNRGSNDYWVVKLQELATGREEPDTASWQVFPNPSSGVLTISGSIPVHEGEIRIVSAQSQVIYHSPFSGVRISADLSGCVPGVYFVLISGETRLQTEKVIIE